MALNVIFRRAASTAQKQADIGDVFMQENVQKMLKDITRFDANKIFARRQVPTLKTPKLMFMSDEQLKRAKEDAYKNVQARLQMPPVMAPDTSDPPVLARDEEIIGYTKFKVMFIDISPGQTDRNRLMSVREVDGTLRGPTHEERSRLNHMFYPSEERTIDVPKLFEEKNLLRLMKRQEYVFVLNRACVQFEPDDPRFVNVTSFTYNYIDQKGDYDKLRSTRHFGPMCLYLAYNKRADDLICEMLAKNLIEDAAKLVKIYYTCHNIKFITADMITLATLWNEQHELKQLNGKQITQDCLVCGQPLVAAYELHIDCVLCDWFLGAVVGGCDNGGDDDEKVLLARCISLVASSIISMVNTIHSSRLKIEYARTIAQADQDDAPNDLCAVSKQPRSPMMTEATGRKEEEKQQQQHLQQGPSAAVSITSQVSSGQPSYNSQLSQHSHQSPNGPAESSEQSSERRPPRAHPLVKANTTVVDLRELGQPLGAQLHVQRANSGVNSTNLVAIEGTKRDVARLHDKEKHKHKHSSSHSQNRSRSDSKSHSRSKRSRKQRRLTKPGQARERQSRSRRRSRIRSQSWSRSRSRSQSDSDSGKRRHQQEAATAKPEEILNAGSILVPLGELPLARPPSSADQLMSSDRMRRPTRVRGQIDLERDLYPFCLVWAPLPIISWFLPLLGHTGISSSRGIIYDFSDDYNASIDNSSFGSPTKYYQLDPNEISTSGAPYASTAHRAAAWDAAIAEVSEQYVLESHNLCSNTHCHQCIAAVLNKLQYGHTSDWDQSHVCYLITFYSTYTGYLGFIRQWWPPAILLLAFSVVLYLLLT